MDPSTPSLLTDRPRLGALTLPRFLAAVWVMLAHMQFMGGLGWAPAWFQGLAGRACVAVTFFFILSGFVLVYTYGGREMDARCFWRARMARIYPVYLLSLLLTAPGFFFFSRFVPGAGWHSEHLGLTAALVLTMQQSWVPLAAIAWNAVCWAVSAEVFFYLLFPWLLSRLSRWSTRAVGILAAASWMAAVGLAVLYVRLSPDGLEITPWNMPDGHFWLHILKFNPMVRLPEFLAGVACGLWFLRGGSAWGRGGLLLLGGSALLGLILALGPMIPYPILHTGLAAPAFAAIVCGLALRPAWSDLLEIPLFRTLGESSYSLFMLHGLTVGVSVFAGSGTPGVAARATALRSVLGVAASILLALAVHRWVEEPWRKRLR